MTATTINPARAKPELINLPAAPVYDAAGAADATVVGAYGVFLAVVAALGLSGAVYLNGAVVEVGAMAVLVHPQVWSYQVYCVPTALVAQAVAGTVEVLWQVQSGSK